MTTTQAAWLAGVIDSEGSFGLRRGKTNYVGYLRIATTDNDIIPNVCSITGHQSTTKKPSGQAKLVANTVKWVGGQCRTIIEAVLPYLYTKKEQALCVLEALSIRNGVSKPYTEAETERWYRLKSLLEQMNLTGLSRLYRSGPIDHRFSWSWLAGLIDGNGSVYLLRNKIGSRSVIKPVLTISSPHLATIDYLSNILDVSQTNSGNRGNRSAHRKIRLTSNKIMEIAPLIISYLTLKKPKLVSAVAIIEARRSRRFDIANELIELWPK